MVWTTQDRVKNSASTMLSPYSRKAFTGRCLPFRLLEPTRGSTAAGDTATHRGRAKKGTAGQTAGSQPSAWRARREGAADASGRPAGASEEGQLAGEATPVGDLPFGQ